MDRAAGAEGGDSVADLNDQEVAEERSAGGFSWKGRELASSVSQVGRRASSTERTGALEGPTVAGCVAPGRPQATELRSEDRRFL